MLIRSVLRHASDTISHPDPNDMTCITSTIRSRIKPLDRPKSLPLEGLVIGIPSKIDYPSFSSILTHLTELGARIKKVQLPNMQLALSAYYVLACAEASSNLARYGGGWFGSGLEKEEGIEGESGEERRRRIRTSGFGWEVKKRILAGTHALSAESV
jgi:aspartyl-tRNA(Asn)/glutamyl-tRNA(Gln) amidotransferase subunit A